MWSQDFSSLSNFTFEVANTFFKEHGVLSRQNSRGYKFFVEGYIHDVWFNTTELVLKAKCYHSQRKNEKPHSLTMAFKTEPTLTLSECHCSCNVGLSQCCHHLLGLAFYMQASTSKPSTWNRPRGTKVIPDNICSVIFQKPTKINRKKSPIKYKFLTPNTSVRNGNDVENSKLINFKNSIKKYNEKIPFSYLINTDNADNEMTTLNLQNVNVLQNEDMENLPILPILNSETMNILISLPLPEVDEFFNFTINDAKDIELKTRGQNKKEEWHQQRKFIFTSSNFGMLCKRVNPFDISFFENLWCPKKIDHIKAIQHGRKEEINARNLYKSQTGNKVYECGLIISQYAPYLGTSPDGIVLTKNNEIGLLEIKCPYGNKTANAKEALKQKGFFLKEDENKKIVINNKHNYYYQIQGQMLITGITWCHLCVYFKKSNETIIVTVEFDSLFCQEMYDKLTDMYNIYLNM